MNLNLCSALLSGCRFWFFYILHVDSGCPVENSLSWKASPYLYPCAVQHSIVAGAVAFQMHRNTSAAHAHAVDAPPSAVRDVIEDAAVVMTTAPVDCDKAHRGIFLGLLVVVLTLVAVGCFFVLGAAEAVTVARSGGEYFRDRYGAYRYSGLIFVITELLLVALSTVAVLIGYARFRSLRFSSGHHRVETALLVFALSGVTAMETFHAIATVSSIGTPPGGGGDAVGLLLAAGTSVAQCFQVLLQTVFLSDALRRSVRTQGQARLKPGRESVSFLLLCNVALLLVSVFETGKTDYKRIHRTFYGLLAWSAISHVTGPVRVFYRFHSAVCLAEIWTGAYRIKEK